MWIRIEEPTTDYARMQTLKCFYICGSIRESKQTKHIFQPFSLCGFTFKTLRHNTHVSKHLNVFILVEPFVNPQTLSSYSNLFVIMWIAIEDPTTHYAPMQTFKCFYIFGAIREPPHAWHIFESFNFYVDSY